MISDQKKEMLCRLVELHEQEATAGEEGAAQSGVFTPPVVDLRTLLGEMASLKAEVRQETRSTRDLRDAVVQTGDSLGQAVERLSARDAARREEQASRRRKSSLQTARTLIDIADRLEPAAHQARELARLRGRWFWRRSDTAAASLLEGLELTIRRLERHLDGLGVQRLITVGKIFDPSVMEALESVERADLEEGTVVDEITAGYQGPDGPMRLAQVIVNRKGAPSA